MKKMKDLTGKQKVFVFTLIAILFICFGVLLEQFIPSTLAALLAFCGYGVVICYYYFKIQDNENKT